MMFEAMAFKFCPLHIKLSTSNFKLKKGLSHVRQALLSSPRWWPVAMVRRGWTVPAPITVKRAAPVPIGVHIQLGQVGVVGHAFQIGLGDDGDAARCRFFDVADGHVCQYVDLARLDGDDGVVISDFSDGFVQAFGRQSIGDMARRLQGDDAFAAQGQVARIDDDAAFFHHLLGTAVDHAFMGCVHAPDGTLIFGN